MHALSQYGEAFMRDWRANYPEMPPINHLFKHRLPKRWMRIHSLSDARRYPRDQADWDLLLSRQNAVIDHLVPQGTPITWVWNRIEPDCHIFKSFDLVPLGAIRDEEDEPAAQCYLLEDVWQTGLDDVFLMMIADESMRAFIIAPDCLISPYDGGMDIILKDPHTAHAFKRHFAAWVSPREDGL
jgi:hypothetical protein